MKNTAITAIVALGAFGAFAQSTDTADANAEIVSAISIVYDGTALEFGQIAQPAANATITVSPAGARSVSAGTATLFNGTTPSAADFTVTGFGTSGFSVTIPASTVDNGVNSMTINNFTTNCAATGCALAAGTFDLKVGGDLQVNANQVVGAYAGTFDVTVAYN